MDTREEWDRAFLTVLPVVSAGFGALSVAFAAMALMRSGGAAARAYYLDGQYLVSVRHFGQWHDVRSFIQPSNPQVVSTYSQAGPDYWSLLDFVCRNISYRRDIGEYWQFPSETLASGQGDCEDSSILLCSLLQNSNGSYVVLGTYCGYGHAWCQVNDEMLETTYTRATPVPDPQNYTPYLYFNDRAVIELWPGALREIFELPRREVTKLNLMAAAMPAEPSSNPGYRYAGLPEACVCESCGYELINPGTHCQAIRCPRCGGVLWRRK